jgi:hypothetical protein
LSAPPVRMGSPPDREPSALCPCRRSPSTPPPQTLDLDPIERLQFTPIDDTARSH